MSAIGIVAAVALLSCVASHVAVLAAIARPPKAWRAAIACVVPPLAPWWAWTRGVRWRVFVWIGAVVAYGIIVTIGNGGAP